MSTKAVTLSLLFKQDMEKAYLFPVFPSSSLENSKYLNKDKYRLYDYPPFSRIFRDIVYPQALSCTTGNEIPVVTDYPPPDFLKQHWKTWLPVFPLPNFISTDEGLEEDGIPIITFGAFQDIPKSKHSVDPDVLQWLQLKSSIPEIGVPHPRHMDEDNVKFPCVVKVDLSYLGKGTFIANNREELSALVKNIREVNGWSGKIIFQELIKDINRIASHIFYLTKTCEVEWIGTNQSFFDGLNFSSLIVNWKEQEKERRLVYDEFAIPIAQFLHRNGYFGLVNFEIIENDRGRYLMDLNPRLSGDISHHLIAPYMASLGLIMSELYITHNAIPGNTSAMKLVETANQLNQVQDGRVIINSALCAEDQYVYHISIFGKTKEDCQALWTKLNIKS